MFSARMLRVQDTSYKTAITATALIGCISFVLYVIFGLLFVKVLAYMGMYGFIIMHIFMIITGLVLIKRRYSLEWKQSLLVWLAWSLISLSVLFLISHFSYRILLYMNSGGSEVVVANTG